MDADAFALILGLVIGLALMLVLLFVALRLSLGLITLISEAWHAGKPLTLSQLEAQKELVRLQKETAQNEEKRYRAAQAAAQAQGAKAAEEKIRQSALEKDLIAYESYTREQLLAELKRVENSSLPGPERQARLAKLRSLL